MTDEHAKLTIEEINDAKYLLEKRIEAMISGFVKDIGLIPFIEMETTTDKLTNGQDFTAFKIRATIKI